MEISLHEDDYWLEYFIKQSIPNQISLSANNTFSGEPSSISITTNKTSLSVIFELDIDI
jgi:hypothetical protein